MLSVLILTKNEERDLPKCLASLAWCNDVHLFDSFSNDKTLDIAREFGAKITQRVFDNWSAHQNWGLKNIRFKYPWVLYVDADECVSPELASAVQTACIAESEYAAFEIQRRDFYYTGKWLKHAQISPLFIRVFRPEAISYERLVNPVTLVAGKTGLLPGYLDHYPFSKGVSFWLERHVRYAEMEAKMKLIDSKQVERISFTSLFSGNLSKRRKAQKKIFYKMPGRPLVKWIYMIVFRRAFLDGRAGFEYAFLQAIYECMISIKEWEIRNIAATKKS